MTRKSKRFAAIVLAAAVIFSLTGCSEEKESLDKQQEDGAAGAKGRYVEELLKTPEKYQGKGSMNVLEDGSLMLVDYENGTVSSSHDAGASWETKKNKVIGKLLNQEQADITSVAVAPDGGIFLSYILWRESTDEKPFPEKYVYLDPDGKKDEFAVGIDDYHSNATRAVFTGNGTVLLLMNDNSVYRLDLKKHRAAQVLDSREVIGLYRFGDTAVAVEQKKVWLYDRESREMDSSDETLNQFVQGDKSETVVFGGDGKDKLLAASAEGIFSHVMQGNVMEQLTQGDITSLGNLTQAPMEMFVLKDGRILIHYNSGELDSYRYDPEAAVQPDHTVSVYSMKDSATVRQAVYAFRKEHPDVYVKVVTGMSGDDGVTESDAVKNLNTELLSGKGPDVIMMDGIPVDSYIEKGMLADLSETLQELEGENSYFENIFEAYRVDGKIYTLPARFFLPIIVGKKDTIEKVTDLAGLADVAEREADSGKIKETVFDTYDERELLTKLWPVCSGTWIRNGEADLAAVTEFLTQAGRIYRAEQKNLDDAERQDHKDAIAQFKELSMEYDPLDGVMQLMGMLLGEHSLSAGLFGDMSDLRQLFSVMNSRKEYSWKLWQGQESGVFVPEGLAAVSANASEPELAREFVKTLLGGQVQEKDLEDGFPVNRDAFAKFSEIPNSMRDADLIVSSAKGSDSVSLSLTWPSEKQLQEFQKVIGTLRTPAGAADRIKEEVFRIGADVLSGEKEGKEGAQEICQRLRLINEE